MNQNDLKALLALPDVLTFKRVLCVQPHPDDNEVGMGGIIDVLSARGCEVHYLTVTNGNKGNVDKNASMDETAAIRREEAEAGGKLLGVRHFHFFDYDDAELSDVLELSKKIAGVMKETKFDAVFCPDPWLAYECHYDHTVTGLAAANAFQMSDAAAIGYYYTANPNTVIDITDSFAKKIEAVAAHKSQFTEQTLAMITMYFEMKCKELAHGRGFELGEGLKLLNRLHSHCFVDAYKI